MLYPHCSRLLYWPREVHPCSKKTSPLPWIHVRFGEAGFHLVTSQKGNVSCHPWKSSQFWCLGLVHSSAVGWKMHFNGPVGPGGQLVHQRDQLRHLSGNSLFTSFQSVPSSAKRIRALALFAFMEWFPPWKSTPISSCVPTLPLLPGEVSWVWVPLKSASATTGVATRWEQISPPKRL